MKKLSLEAIETARQIFINNAFTVVDDSNREILKMSAESAIEQALIFQEAIEKNQAVNFSVDLGSGVDAGIKTVISAVDNQAANSFNMFSILLGFAHVQKYRKTPIIEGAVTCFYDGVDYCDHAYPEWMVCKTKDRDGGIYGWSTENLTYFADSGYWKSNDPEAKFVQLLCEDCLVESRESLISTDLPFF